jgi:hypothetical protein
MSRTALIGYTGFVGSNLQRQANFTDVYNSKNIGAIDNQTFDLVVCAGARAAKWLINQQPEQDLQEITKLINHLKTITTKQFVLISTVDVYNEPVGVDEETPISAEGPFTHRDYAKHRYMLEEFCRQQFPGWLVIRLSGLFGPGLKKNVIYDLLHNNNVEKIHRAGTFQYYNLEHIWRDIQTALANHLILVNFMSEPVRTDELAHECFGLNFTNEPEGVKPAVYDMHSRYAEVFGGGNGYLASKQQILDEIKAFVAAERRSHA